MIKKEYLKNEIKKKIKFLKINKKFEKKIVKLTENELIFYGYIENDLNNELDQNFKVMLSCYDLKKIIMEIYNQLNKKMFDDYKLICRTLKVSCNKDSSLYYYLN